PSRARMLADLLAGRPVRDSSYAERGRRPPKGIEVLVHRPVTRGAENLGEVLIVRPDWPRGGMEFFRSPTFVLFLPIALIASVATGFFMVRLLVRRLAALELLAARVAEGDL